MEMGNNTQQLFCSRRASIIKNNKTANQANLNQAENNSRKHPGAECKQKLSPRPRDPKAQRTSKKKSALQGKSANKSTWKKGIDCLKHLYYRFLCPREDKVYLIIKEKDLLSSIDKMRKATDDSSAPYLRPLRDPHKKTLVIDLEGVFVESSRHKLKKYDFTVCFEYRGKETKVYCKIRPGSQMFLEEMAQLYEIILFTSCQKQYANGILSKISKPGQIKHRLYREKCLNLNLVYYLKEMRKLNRDPTKVIFVDCNVATGVLQPLNFHMIKRYNCAVDDAELQKVSHFFKWLSEKEVVTPIFKNYQTYLGEQASFSKDPAKYELQDTHIKNTENSLCFFQKLCEKQQDAAENELRHKQGEQQPQKEQGEAIQNHQQTTTQSSLIQVDYQPRQKSMRLEKVVASKKIFTRIGRSLKKLEAQNVGVQKLQGRSPFGVEERPENGKQKKHKRVNSQTPLINIMKRIMQEEIRKSTKILQTTS